MNKIFAKTLRQVTAGRIISGVGLALYLAGSALELSDRVMLVPLILFALAALWTMLSIVLLPRKLREQEGTVGLIWGQFAVTVLLVGCAVLTVRALLAG